MDGGKTSTYQPGGWSGIRRNRPSYSCEGCRARRVKCDLAQPKCGSCARSGADCVYPTQVLKRKNSDGTTHVAGSSKDSKRKPSTDTEAPPDTITHSGGHAKQAEETFWASVDTTAFDDDTLDNLPILPLEQMGLCSDATASPYLIGPTQPPTLINIIPGVDNEVSVASLLQRLPDKEICDYLYSVFLYAVHPIIPYMHVPTFDQHYRRFWTCLGAGYIERDISAKAPTFVPMLFAILYAGAITDPWLGIDHSMDSLEIQPASYLSSTSDALLLAGFPHTPTIYSLMAYLMLHMNHLRSTAASICSSTAMAIRVAQAMGLHRDGSHYGLDPISTEQRRRVWGHLMHLDMLTSFNSCLPPVVGQDGLSDTQPISELRDEDVGTKHERTEKEGAEQDAYIPYVFVRARYEISQCVKSYVLEQATHRSVTLLDFLQLVASLNELGTRIQTQIEAIRSSEPEDPILCTSSTVAATQYLTSSRLRPSTVTFAEWAETALQYSLEQAYCALYSSAMKDAAIWTEVRSAAIPHFQQSIRYFTHLLEPDFFVPMRWMYPGYYQPVQSAVVLLMDLYRLPTSVESEESKRILAQLFRMLELQPEGIVGGASTLVPAWGKLEPLRKKVFGRLELLKGDGYQMADISTGTRSLDHAMDWPNYLHSPNTENPLQTSYFANVDTFLTPGTGNELSMFSANDSWMADTDHAEYMSADWAGDLGGGN